ncbi:MAG: prolipoprotein diacylglyceryl transferase [Erysipelothrix sp.]|nr:prolipoprotein diacylglyceryl transferase [Erysipelothrix sp.]
MIEFFPDLPTFLKIGPVTITWYALLIVIGAYAAYYISLQNLKKMGYTTDDADGLFFGVLIFGILGARLWYVMFYDLSFYLQNPASILNITEGGLAIHGGIFAAVIYGYIYISKKGYNFIHWLDAVLPNVLLSQAIGRWGNFMNQEAFGGIVSESHFRFLPNFIKETMFINGAYRAPTFLYESILNLIGFLLITQVIKKSKKLKRGDQSFFYLIFYGVIRFIIEGMRTDALPLNLGFIELRIAQVISVIFVIVGVMGVMGVFKKFFPKVKPTLVFDFDGTIMDTQELIHQTFIEVFKVHKPDYILSQDDLYSFLGPTLMDSFRRFFEEDKVDELVTHYRELNLEIHDKYVKPMDHVIDVLTRLKAEGYTMSIVSSKVRKPIEYALEMTGMSHLFDSVYGMDDYDKVKPDPEGILKAMKDNFYDRSSFIYLGDTVTDIEAGRSAGAYTIGYVFDEKRRQDLVDSNPNAIIDDWRELEEILRGDHEWTYNTI